MRRCCALGLVALLAGCAVAPRVPLPADTAAIRDFELSGRVAVRLEGRGYSARLRWQHRDSRDALWLYSPVGSVLARLTVAANSAVLTTADQATFHSSDVQELTREVLGWDLPLEGLQHWVVARPDPHAPIEDARRDPRDRLKSLRQRDWTISYLAYAADSGLPSSMALQYGDLQLKLVIDRWHHAAPAP